MKKNTKIFCDFSLITIPLWIRNNLIFAYFAGVDLLLLYLLLHSSELLCKQFDNVLKLREKHFIFKDFECEDQVQREKGLGNM